MTATTNWRSELLPKLSGLPLVPCGAGDKFKAPIDPTTGRGMSNWQNQVFTPEEIAAMGPRVICVGTRLGPQAGGIVCFDIDGVSAVNKAIEWGADPDPGGSEDRSQRSVSLWQRQKIQEVLPQSSGLLITPKKFPSP